MPQVTSHEENLTEEGQVKKLWAGVEKDTGSALLVNFLANLIRVANVPERDPVALARAIQLYSANHIKFFRERPERFASALRTLTWGMGDCDDKARFVAASLRSFRIPVQLVVLHITLPNGEEKGHVYPEAWLPFPKGPSQWVPLESVRVYPMGYDPAKRCIELGFKVRKTIIGDKGVDDIHV